VLTEDPRYNEYYKDMMQRLTTQAKTLPILTLNYLTDILVNLMTSTEATRENYCHISLKDPAVQHNLLPYPVALDILRLCGFDYCQLKNSGDSLEFSPMEEYEELYFKPSFSLIVVETMVERLLRLQP